MASVTAVHSLELIEVEGRPHLLDDTLPLWNLLTAKVMFEPSELEAVQSTPWDGTTWVRFKGRGWFLTLTNSLAWEAWCQDQGIWQ